MASESEDGMDGFDVFHGGSSDSQDGMDEFHNGSSEKEYHGDHSSDSCTENLSSAEDANTPKRKKKYSTGAPCTSSSNENMEGRNHLREAHVCRTSHSMFCNIEERNAALQEFDNIVHMTFASDDQCYNFYNIYARKKGFSVRKDIVRRVKKVGGIYYRRYVCSKEGSRDAELCNIKDRKRKERAQTRNDCPARLSIMLDKDRGFWFVDDFVDDHNHTLTGPDETPFLRSHRKIKDYQKFEIMLMESRGIRKHVIMDIMECKHGGYEKVGFVRKDIYNFSSRYKRSRIVDGDANAALQIMKARRDKDPDFFYEYQVDGEGRMKNLFWCDAQSRMDYQSFGDVVVFDSTYRLNRYKMPFVPFVGLNHHRQTTIFACGIVSDECVASYTWLLGVFLRAMCQQKPRSIITDSDNAMMRAIRKVLPETNHRVCSWHIEKGIKKHLHYSYQNIFRSFIYDACSLDVFEEKWATFVSEYRTSRNQSWLDRMYRKRRLWVAAFLDDKYFLGMRSNQRSESLNSRLHRHLDNYMSLVDLVEHYEVCISGMRQREANFDSIASQSWPVAITDNRELEEAAGHTFTKANFDLVQEELQKLGGFDVGEVIQDGGRVRYSVTSNEKQGEAFSVDYTCLGSASLIKCSCRKMERDGIPCKHTLRVVKHLEMTEIPKCCVLQRLSKDAKGGLPSIRSSDLHVWTVKQARYHELSTLGSELFDLASNSHEGFAEVKEYILSQISTKMSSSNPANDTCAYVGENDASIPEPQGLVLDPTIVVTKGAPGGRIKSFDDRRQRLCSRCRQPDHDIRRCPVAMQEE